MFDLFNQKKDYTRLIHNLERSVKATNRWQMIWSGTITTILASIIISIGQPLWEITVVHPLTLAKLKQDLGEHLKDHKELEKRLILHDKLLAVLTAHIQELKKDMGK